MTVQVQCTRCTYKSWRPCAGFSCHFLRFGFGVRGPGCGGVGWFFFLREARTIDQNSSESHDGSVMLQHFARFASCKCDRGLARTKRMAGCSRTLSAFAGGQTLGFVCSEEFHRLRYTSQGQLVQSFLLLACLADKTRRDSRTNTHASTRTNVTTHTFRTSPSRSLGCASFRLHLNRVALRDSCHDGCFLVVV